MTEPEIIFPQITAQHRTRAPWMRQAYKNLSTRIHALKGTRKRPVGFVETASSHWTGYVEGLDDLCVQARVLNIARGLLHGLKLEQIEPKPRLASGTSGDRAQYRALVKQAIGLITDSFPIYVAVNTAIPMTIEQKAIQAGHALAVMVQGAPGIHNVPWTADGGTLKYVDGAMLFGPSTAKFESNVNQYALENPASTWATFAEPDLKGLVTAAAIFAPFGLPWKIRHMPLLKLTPDLVTLQEPPASVQQLPGIFARLTGHV